MEKVTNNELIVRGEQKKFDTPDQVRVAFEAACNGKVDLCEITKITIGGNSYGFEACQWLAE
jgi:Ran GTPase-activating protein (RanGAP) involved in mRNA processing and transport